MLSPLALLLLAVAVFAVETLQSPLAPTTNGDNEEWNSSSVLFRKKRAQEEYCGYVKSGSRIKEGDVTDIEDFAWTAVLFYGDGESAIPRCGGVLISTSVVVTAAHCLVEGSNQKNLTFVRLGEYDLNADPDCIKRDPNDTQPECFKTQVDINPKSIMIHPDYKSNIDNHHDIALIHLEVPVIYNSFVLPICLPDQSFEVSKQRNFTVVGWGLTDHFRPRGYSTMSSPIKLSEKLQQFDWQTCENVYSTQITLGTGQLCAGGELNKDTCRGDSGSPLMTLMDGSEGSYWMLVGLVSLGPLECGTVGKPGIYTNVREYVDWIEDNMKVDV